METNLAKVKELAKDLSRDEPRPASEELGGFPLAGRALDKCRAALAGTQADFTFNCPMDQRFFSASGINAAEFKDFVATGASDQQVDQWIREHARKEQSPR
jgi:hypothetical protein